MTDLSSPFPPTPLWYDRERARDIVHAYNVGGGSAQPADDFVAHSVLPGGTGATRDFSYIAPQLPEYDAARCTACLECVNNCPDTAILGKVVRPEVLDDALTAIDDDHDREHQREQFGETVKYHRSFEKKHERDATHPRGALFGIFVDPTKCKGCGECVDVCGTHNALTMVKKTPDNLAHYQRHFEFYKSLPDSPNEYISDKDMRDLMLKPENLLYVGGAGSCMGCGEATTLRMMTTITAELVGRNFGVVAATGCNTVYGSTYPFNPYLAPWTNSLFENAPADAMGIRLKWNQQGHSDRVLWVVGGDGAMLDIGFQSLSRMLASGMNIKVLILDTQVYSNTGGQTSTASFHGQDAKMSGYGRLVHGKQEHRKEIGNICMMHPHTFVAQTVAAKSNHFYGAVKRAIEFDGPAVINAYTTCQPEHGVADDKAAEQSRHAVDSRTFPLFVYDPDAGETFHECLSLKGNPAYTQDWYVKKSKDGPDEVIDFIHWARTEGRFRKHFNADGDPSPELLESQRRRLANWRLLQELAGVDTEDRAQSEGDAPTS